MQVKAYAKVNLTLDILRRRSDGYHDLQMVMQSVDLSDTLTITPVQGRGRMSTTLSFLPGDDRNLAQSAAAAFRTAAGSGPQVDIHIEKRIPVCAGRGGGSADAAAVLHAMNALTGAALPVETLAEAGMQVGSDVPFCVLGGTALAEGRGERLTPLPALPECHVVICKPPFPISTPKLFAQVDVRRISRRPDTAGLIAALEGQDLPGVARRLYNVFEDVLDPRQRSQICAIKAALIDCGALGASMSGSGPSVFGLFDRAEAAQSAYGQLARRFRDTFLCKTIGTVC